MLNIHEKIRELRIENGMTQADLAKELGIAPQTLSFYEKGREPNLEIVKSLSEIFHVSSDYLLGLSTCKTLDEQFVKDKYSTYINEIISQQPVLEELLFSSISSVIDVFNNITNIITGNIIQYPEEELTNQQKLQLAKFVAGVTEIAVFTKELYISLNEIILTGAFPKYWCSETFNVFSKKQGDLLSITSKIYSKFISLSTNPNETFNSKNFVEFVEKTTLKNDNK